MTGTKRDPLASPLDDIRLVHLTQEDATRLAEGAVAMRKDLGLDPPTEEDIAALIDWAENLLTSHGLLENVLDGTLWADWRPGQGPTFRVTPEGTRRVEAQAAEAGGLDNLMRRHGLEPSRALKNEKGTLQ